MKKNLMDKMRNSHNNNKEPQPVTWLYSADGVQGYVTSDGELLDLRPEGDTI